MGIEEYRYLTKTMDQIADCSGKLESSKKKLSQTGEKIRNCENAVKDVKFKKKNKNIEGEIEKLKNRIEVQENETSNLPTLKTLRTKLTNAENKIDPEGIRKLSPSHPSIFQEVRVDQNFVTNFYFTYVFVILIFWDSFSGFSNIMEDLASRFQTQEGFLLFLLIIPAVIIWLIDQMDKRNLRVMGDEWEEKDSIVNQINKEVRPIRNDISALELLAVNVSRLRSLEGELGNVNQKLGKLERKLAKDKKTSTDLSDQISSLEEEIRAHWDSIAHLIPFSTALEKA